MPAFSRKSALAATAIVAATASSTTAFSPVISRTATPSVSNDLAPRSAPTSLSMSADDEVAKLRAAAQKAREEAQALAKSMGKDLETMDKPQNPKAPVAKDISNDEVASISSSVDFDAGDAVAQTKRLDELVQSGDFTLWKSAVTGPNPLRTYPVSLDFLSSRTGGQINGESLGISGEMDVSLDDFKDATIGVTLASTVLAIGSLIVLPENIGATLCYLFALIPIVFIAVGSSAPGLIAAGIATTRGTADDQAKREDRICRHEAGHFLCGYLCGLPVKNYEITDSGFPCVEFHPSGEGEATGRELSQEEIAALSVVAMSGSVAEALSLGEAKGGENDLLELDLLFRRSKEFIGAAKQQELTRWGALVAYQQITANKNKYEALVQAFKDKKSVSECVAAIEGRA
mmetsp:Transcript_26189/g.56733  ORF Transcript_26189/g.56733 Transcript_26189/m.56733 type:complete len:403 (-) Transcript_26189:59-1267(-)